MENDIYELWEFTELQSIAENNRRRYQNQPGFSEFCFIYY